jgi:menaquinone C8-methyltransferase
MRLLTKRYFSLNEASIQRLPLPKPRRVYMLYAHVPFCETLCPYCSFNRFIFQEDRARAYFRQLRAEMQMAADLGYQFDSLYIGGGTPTVQVDELIKTIELARKLFGMREVSCETNPNHLTAENARLLSPHIQRMSVGVQSFNDAMLRKMNRYDRFGSGKEVQQQIRSVAGIFDFLNIDLIFNLPGQSEAMLAEDIERAKNCDANQITFYPLMSSPSVANAMQQTLGEISYAREERYYQQISAAMNGGFSHSTAWNFGRLQNGALADSPSENMIDEYIVNYGEYLGIGSGSFSFLDGSLYVNTFSLNEYRQKIEGGQMAVSAYAQFGRHQQMQYRLMMDLFGLRLDKQRFKNDFGIKVDQALPVELGFLQTAGAFAHNDRDEITLTPHGRYMLLVMMREFFVAINNVRDQARRSLPDAERLQLCTPTIENRLIPEPARYSNPS